MVIAGVALIVWRVHQSGLREMASTETLSCSELGELQAAAAKAVGAGSFSRRCEVVGTTAPGPQGVLIASMADVAGDAWRPEYQDAWTTALTVVAGAMLEGAATAAT